MIKSDFLKLYEELNQLNEVKVDTQKSIDFVDNKNKLHEKWYDIDLWDRRIWYSDSPIEFKNFMANIHNTGLKGVRLCIAPGFYLVANAMDFNHDTMLEIAKEELYLETPASVEMFTCGIPKCVDFDAVNFEIKDLARAAEDNPDDSFYDIYRNYDANKQYQGNLIANYGTFELDLDQFKTKAIPEYKPKNGLKNIYFEDSETYAVLKPLFKKVYIYGVDNK